MLIRKAEQDEFQAVRELYYAVIDGIGDSGDSVAWKKDVYPDPEFLEGSIRNGELYIAEENGIIIGAMVVNHKCSDEYNKCQWKTQADGSEVTVIHALAVHPEYTRKGYAKKMVGFVIDDALGSGQKAIRLDVLKGNKNAEKLYSGMGFIHLQTLPMFYEDTGWTDFELFEYPL